MKNYITSFVLVVFLIGLSNCDQGTDLPSETDQVVRYEISGTYTGTLTIVYSDNINGNTVLSNVSLPWSVEVKRGRNVLAVGITAQSNLLGVSGQVANMKIVVKGNVVQTSTAVAGTLGELVLPGLAYSF